jgi:hypothetical protein
MNTGDKSGMPQFSPSLSDERRRTMTKEEKKFYESRLARTVDDKMLELYRMALDQSTYIYQLALKRMRAQIDQYFEEHEDVTQ